MSKWPDQIGRDIEAHRASQSEITTERLTGKALEQILVARHNEYKQANLASIGRYGVQCTQIGPNRSDIVQIKSLPDFEGLKREKHYEFGRHVIFDSKACSQASFNLNEYRKESKGSKRRQLTHVLARSEYGAICFFLIHWNDRKLATKHEPPETFAFWIHSDSDFWLSFEAGEIKSFNRRHCVDYGTPIVWNRLGRARTSRPDWLAATANFPF